MLVRAKNVAMDVSGFECGAVLTQIPLAGGAVPIADLTRACARESRWHRAGRCRHRVPGGGRASATGHDRHRDGTWPSPKLNQYAGAAMACVSDAHTGGTGGTGWTRWTGQTGW
jgi:hypothetical protein